MQLLLRCFLSSAWKLPLYFLHTKTVMNLKAFLKPRFANAKHLFEKSTSRIKIPIQLPPASRTLKLNTFKRRAFFNWSSKALVKPSFSKERVVKKHIAVVIYFCLTSTNGLGSDLEADTPH